MTDPQRPDADDDPAMCRHGTRESEGWCAQCEVLGHDPKVTSADDERVAEYRSEAERGRCSAARMLRVLDLLDARTRERDEARAALDFLQRGNREYVAGLAKQRPELARLRAEIARRAEQILPPGDAEGWIEWHGGECPTPPGSKFQYRLRDGGTGELLTNALAWEWRHHNSPYDIVAYRLVSGASDDETEARIAAEYVAHPPSADMVERVRTLCPGKKPRR